MKGPRLGFRPYKRGGTYGPVYVRRSTADSQVNVWARDGGARTERKRRNAQGRDWQHESA